MDRAAQAAPDDVAVPAQDRVRGDQQPQPVAAGFRYHGEQGREQGPVRPGQLRAARLPPLQDPDTAARMAAAVSQDPDTALRVHTREELGVDPICRRRHNGSYADFTIMPTWGQEPLLAEVPAVWRSA
jgi:hypothetical protein